MKTQTDIYQSKIEKYHSWNFTLNVVSSAFDRFGLSLVGTKTVLPAFLTLFTKSNFIIGLLPALHQFFWAFPQLVSSLYTGHFPQKKNVIVFIKMGYALPWLILSILTLFFIRPQSPLSLFAFFVLFSLFALLGGFAMPTWVFFISKLIFPKMRGKFYALRVFVGTSFGVLAAFIVKGLLDKYQYPLNFSLIFLLAFFMFLMGIIFLAVIKEPLTPFQVKKRSPAEYFTELGDIVRTDKPFYWFIISVVIRSFSVVMMASAFYTVYAIRQLHVDLTEVGIFMGIMLSVQSIGGLVLGYITDLKDPKIVQILSRLFEFLSAGAILLHADIIGVYVAFGFLGLAQAGMMTSYHNLIIELAPKEKVDTYMGLINGIRSPVIAIAPLIGGFLADSLSFKIVFVIALFATVFSGLVLFLKVKFRKRF